MRALYLATTCLVIGVGGAAAQDRRALSDAELIGDPATGERLASEVCAACHAIGPGGATAADAPTEAPPFRAIADTPGMTGRAIAVWLTTFHPERTMPAIVLTDDERRDVIAYILSLQED